MSLHHALLQFGASFAVFRLFGLLFAAVALAMVIAPKRLTGRRVTTSDGEAARIEPTGAQLLLVRLIAGVFVLVGLALALGGPMLLF